PHLSGRLQGRGPGLSAYLPERADRRAQRLHFAADPDAGAWRRALRELRALRRQVGVGGPLSWQPRSPGELHRRQAGGPRRTAGGGERPVPLRRLPAVPGAGATHAAVSGIAAEFALPDWSSP